MNGKRRLLVVLLAALVVLVAAAIVALTRDYDSPELGRALLARAGHEAGLDVKAEGFRLNLLRGLKLENVEVTSRTPGAGFHARADRLVFTHRLGPLLRGQVRIDEIVLERPAVELVSQAEVRVAPPSGAPPPSAEPAPPEPSSTEPPAGEAGLDLSVSRFAIVDGSLVVKNAGAAEGDAAAEGTTEIRGLDFELRDIALDPAAPSVVQGLTATGEIAADEVVTAATRATDARGKVRVEGGHVRIEDFQLPTAQGRLVVGRLDVDLNADPYGYELTLAGDPLNTNLLLGAGDDGGLGPGNLDLGLSGDGSENGHLAGQGTLAFAAGRLPALPVLSAIQKIVGSTIVGAGYEPFEVHFAVRGDHLAIEPFRIVSGELELELSGTVGFAGALALDSVLRAPREGVEAVEVPKEVVEALTDAEGRVNLPIIIRGSQESPKVAFDRSGWGKMARKRVESEAKKEIGKKLGKLFGKKKDG